MIEIETADNLNVCNSCYAEDDLKYLFLKRKGGSGIPRICLCRRCRRELLKKLNAEFKEDQQIFSMREIEIIKELDHPLYTVEYLEKWVGCCADVNKNPAAALQSMGATGYYNAVKQMAQSPEKRTHHRELPLKDVK